MAPDDTATTLVGTTVGNYEVIDRLGAGAMGEVYLGQHPAIGRRVAIKVVMGSLSTNQEVTGRFLSEARAVSKINHPNIIQIFDFGTLPDGRLYYIMEYLDGQDLSNLLADRAPLPPAESVVLLRQITAAMEAAHAAGIVHRDLKPDNIFVADTEGGPLVKILDFGIAKLLEPAFGSESRTATGMIMGTPMYMSPEQAAGQVNQISPRTDIYALGIIAYEMLSGRCPFFGKTTAVVLTMHITEPPPPLKTFVDGLAPTLETFIQRALAKAPSDRQQTMTEFFAEFEQASSGGPDALMPTMATAGSAPSPTAPAAELGEAQTMASIGPGVSLNAGPDTGPDTGSVVETTLGRSAAESVPAGAMDAGGRSSGLRALLVAIVILLGLGVAVGAYYGLGGTGSAPESSSTSAAPVADAPDAAVAQNAKPTTRPANPVRRPPPARPQVRRTKVRSKMRRLKIRVTVPGAPVYTRKTPFTVDALQGQRVILTAHRRGYHSETRTVVIDQDSRIVFALTRLGRPRPRPRPHPRPMVAEPPAMRPAMRPAMQPAMQPAKRPMDYGESTISPF